jgi:hypothetical protein
VSLTAGEFLADVAAVYTGGEAKGAFGSGRLIAPGLVLTAGHVVDYPTRSAPTSTGWKVRLLRDRSGDAGWVGSPYEAELLWRGSADLDLALLKFCGDVGLMPALQPVFASYDEAGELAEVDAAGFPEAWYTDTGALRDYAVRGKLRISPQFGPYAWSVRPADTPQDPRGWKGMSGAAICHLGSGARLYLFGAVQEVPANFSGGLLRVARLAYAFRDDVFRGHLRTALVRRPQLSSWSKISAKARRDRKGREQAASAANYRKVLATREREEKLAFAAKYRRAVREVLDYVEILGLTDLDPRRRDAQLSIAYLSLTTSAAGIGRLSYENLLDQLPQLGRRLLVEGTAGSGKSTLLRWAAVEAAKEEAPPQQIMASRARILDFPTAFKVGDEDWVTVTDYETRRSYSIPFESYSEAILAGKRLFAAWPNVSPRLHRARGQWRKTIPFQIRLRHLKEGFPEPEQFPTHLSTAIGKPPPGWVEELLQNGQAMLLIDGVDEVPEGTRREAALRFILDYAKLYEQSLIIVASRPGAFDKSMFAEMNFVQAKVDELSEPQRNEFIDNWHRAYALQRPRRPHDPDPKVIAGGLKNALIRQPQIARLATNPLLCAAICALHERRPNYLPKSEWEICASLSAMLVDHRDRHPGRQGNVDIEEFGPEYQLDYAVRRSILARLADAMIAQRISALPREEALSHVKATLQGVRDAANLDPNSVLASLVARSGVLREASIEIAPVDDSTSNDERDAVEFVHNTLKAWFASLESLEQNKPRAVANESLNADLAEVIVFAAAAPTQKVYAEKLIRALLAFASQQNKPDFRRAVQLVALRCDAVAAVLDSNLRRQLAQVADVLFPPTTFEEAGQLAVLGDAAVPRLVSGKVSADRLSAAIRCLRLIGSESARTVLEGYRDATDPEALEELTEIFDPLTLPPILKAAQNALLWVTLRLSIKKKIQNLSQLGGKPKLRRLWLSDTSINSLEPLVRLPELSSLNIDSTAVKDLSPLRSSRNIEELSLCYTRVDDVQPLTQLNRLQKLLLYGVRADLSPLANSASLNDLAIGSRSLVNLDFLSELLNLRTLSVLDAKLASIGPIASIQQIEKLVLWKLEVKDISPLARLSCLEKLDIRELPVDNLVPLGALAKLSEVYLRGLEADDISPLAGSKQLAKLTIMSLPVRDLVPLRAMTRLQSLTLADLPADDIGPVSHLADLRSLSISNMRIQNVAPLSQLSNLEFLDISKTQVHSLEPLIRLSNLRHVTAIDTPLPTEQVERFVAAGPGRDVRTLRFSAPV